MEEFKNAVLSHLAELLVLFVCTMGACLWRWLHRSVRRRRRHFIQAFERVRQFRKLHRELTKLRRENQALLSRLNDSEAKVRKLQPDKLLKESDLDEDCLAFLRALVEHKGSASAQELESALNVDRMHIAGSYARLREYKLVAGSYGTQVSLTCVGAARLHEWGMLSRKSS